MDMGNETPHSIIAAAFAQLEEGGSVSLDSVARAVGLTKHGSAPTWTGLFPESSAKQTWSR